MKISDYFDAVPSECLFPKDRRMDAIRLNGIEGMSSENIRFVMNEIVRVFCKELYVEVGTYKGCSLISASLNNTHIKAIGIDNFSQFDGCADIVNANLMTMGCNNAKLINGDYKDVIPSTFSKKSIDVYFYDGEHSYNSQIDGLNIIKPYLKDDCVIFVDDASWVEPSQANSDWLEQNPDFKSVLLTVDGYTMQSNGNNAYWWNGLNILYRNIDISL